MRFDHRLLSILSAALLLKPALAGVNIAFYGGTNCLGSGVIVYNVGAQACAMANFGAGSIEFDNVPSGAKTQAYSSANSCTGYAGESGSGLSVCISSGNLWSANWFYPYKKLARSEEPSGPTRYGVRYVLPDGTTKEVEVPIEDVESAWNLVEAEDFESLDKYPTFIQE